MKTPGRRVNASGIPILSGIGAGGFIARANTLVQYFDF